VPLQQTLKRWGAERQSLLQPVEWVDSHMPLPAMEAPQSLPQAPLMEDRQLQQRRAAIHTAATVERPQQQATQLQFRAVTQARLQPQIGGSGGGVPCCGIPGIGIAGVANAASFASTINGYLATAQSTATGSSGQAQASAQTTFASVNSVQAVATGQVGGTGPTSAFAQVGGGASIPGARPAGQSFSVVNTVASVPLTLAFGSMGAGYGGSGSSLTYQQSATFAFNNASGSLLIDFLGSNSLGNGFDSALFQISDNGNLIVNQSFTSLASAEAYLSTNNLINMLAGGLNNVQLSLNEIMSAGEGFSFDYAAAGGVTATPLPPAWTMMLIGLAGFGFVAHRRKSKAALKAA
jgi:hypothetical protein